MTPTDPAQVQHLPGKLAQTIADVLINAHPHLSTISEAHKARFREQFLDGLEQHIATLTGPLLESVSAQATIPDELKSLLIEMGAPTEQFTGLLNSFFIFGVMFNLANTMLQPFMQQVANDIWSAHPDRPLSPPDIATAVVRGIGKGDSAGVTIEQWAVDEAAKSGIDPEVFKTMVGVTGMAPNLSLLFEMVRRGIIPEGELNGGGTTLVSGIQQSDIKDEWIPMVSKLRYTTPTPIDMVRAAIQAQLPYDEAASIAAKLGLEPPGYVEDNPDWFKVLFDIAGRPPGPVEMGRAANRGLIPWHGTGPEALTFQQAIAESDIKTKWTDVLQELARYYPPNGEIRTLLMHGGINETQAKALWLANGVPPEIADAYLYLARTEQITQDKALAKGDVLTLVQEQAISDADAMELLAQIGYSGENAAHLLSMAHFRYALEALRNVVRKISTLYATRKITATQTKEALEGIGMPEAQVAALMVTLTHERDSIVLVPTPAQITSAAHYKVITMDEAMQILQEMGYSQWGAWLELSVREHGQISPEPPRPPAGY